MKRETRTTAERWDNALQTLGALDVEPEIEVVDFLRRMAGRGSMGGLDIGSGTGRHTIAGARLQLSMAAVDISTHAVKTTKRHLENASLDAIGIVAASAERLPFAERSFDFCLAICSLNHGREQSFVAGVHEAIRVLRPGGSMLGMVLSKTDPRYGVGTQLETDCYVFDSGPEAGIAHYFASEASIGAAIHGQAELVQAFEVSYSGADTEEYYPGLQFARHLVFEVTRLSSKKPSGSSRGRGRA